MRKIPLCAFFAALIVSLSYFLSNARMDWGDEGFLWYGAQALLRGEIPMRDFYGYEPGRYAWIAAFFKLRQNSGLMSMRLACISFQFFGLFLGLAALSKHVRSSVFLFGTGVLLYFWMLATYRLFDASLVMLLFFMATALAEKPTSKRYLASGAVVGFISFFALNHTLYAFLTFYAVALYAEWKNGGRLSLSKRMNFLTGGVLGSSPLWGMWLCVPGFWQGYVQYVSRWRDMATKNLLNIPHPFPWPGTSSWKEIRESMPSFWPSFFDFARAVSVEIIFFVLLAYALIGLVVLFKMNAKDWKKRSFFAASVLMSYVYLPHAFARAEDIHIGEAFLPVLGGILVLGSIFPKSIKRSVAGALVVLVSVATLFAVGTRCTILFKILAPREGLVRFSIGKDQIWLAPPEAMMADRVMKTVQAHVKPHELILMGPVMAAFYCMLEKPSPIQDIYMVLPMPEWRQRQMLEDLEKKRVNWAFISDACVDGFDSMRISQTLPILWDYLMKKFVIVPAPSARSGYFLLRRGELL